MLNETRAAIDHALHRVTEPPRDKRPLIDILSQKPTVAKPPILGRPGPNLSRRKPSDRLRPTCGRSASAQLSAHDRAPNLVRVACAQPSNQNNRMPVSYPFVPKTNTRLSEGDFWAVPLVDGSYACGRVLQLPPKAVSLPGSKIQFLGALMDWHGDSVPSVRSLEGSHPLKRGVMHVKSIYAVGGGVIGNRSLSLEGIEPGIFIDGTEIRCGYDYHRAYRTSDLNVLETWSWWGWNVIWLMANRHFLGVDLPSDTEPTPRPE